MSSAHVERITTQDFKPLISETKLNDIIKNSVTTLLISNKKKININIEDKATITTDIKLLSLAVKNLLDNALKYGDGEIMVIANTNSIQVISIGNSLEHPLDYYLEPFTQEEKRNSGFGLGLYIVYNIVNRLNYKLNYFHKNGKNIFELQLN